MSRFLRIAIDGPAASGKSTTAQRVARTLNYGYIDTGAMYRAVTLKCLENGVDPKESMNKTKVADIAQSATVRFPALGKVELDGNDVSHDIRSSLVSRSISAVAANTRVRDILTHQQRTMAAEAKAWPHVEGVVMDGRDIGTVVLPDAELKVFIVADPLIRAQRRFDQLKAKHGLTPNESVEDIARDLAARDRADTTRRVAPLKQASDAVVLDTSHCTMEEQVQAIIDRIHSL
ncbi:cytidylate kinase [Spinellus fusiger]|nr:cytidylate kinase [Spinellus fusiger]